MVGTTFDLARAFDPDPQLTVHHDGLRQPRCSPRRPPRHDPPTPRGVEGMASASPAHRHDLRRSVAAPPAAAAAPRHASGAGCGRCRSPPDGTRRCRRRCRAPRTTTRDRHRAAGRRCPGSAGAGLADGDRLAGQWRPRPPPSVAARNTIGRWVWPNRQRRVSNEAEVGGRDIGSGDVLPDRVARRAVDRGQVAVAAHLRQGGEVGARVVVDHLAGPLDRRRASGLKYEASTVPIAAPSWLPITLRAPISWSAAITSFGCGP